jgi:hypothetical protein
MHHQTPLEIWIWYDINYHTIYHPLRMHMKVPLTGKGIKPSGQDDEICSAKKDVKYWKNNGQSPVPIPHSPYP